MAKNTKTSSGKSTRKGCVKNRTQYYNEKTDTYMKRNEKGQFISGKKGKKYKSVKQERKKKNKN